MVKAKRRRPTEFQREFALYVAKVVRDNLENLHVKYIPDEVMPEFNKRVRDAVCTALYAFMNVENDPQARSFVRGNNLAIPHYWEQPELFDEFSHPFLCSYCKVGDHENCLRHKKDRVCICLIAKHKDDIE